MSNEPTKPAEEKEENLSLEVTFSAKQSTTPSTVRTYIAVCLASPTDGQIARGTYTECLAAAQEHSRRTLHVTQVREE